MGKVSEKAKAKLDAVLNDPNRHDCSGQKNRVITTRYPSMGGSEVTDRVNRRFSTTSQSSQGSSKGRLRSWVRDMMSPPAY